VSLSNEVTVDNMMIVRTRPGHETIMARFFQENDGHFKPWSPAVPADHHSVDSWQRRLENRDREFERGQSVHFIGTDSQQTRVVGTCSLSSIVRGVFQACHMGYSVGTAYEGQGLMKRIVSHTVDYAFNVLNLHRIMANHMPNNERSASLLKSLGFEREGYARDYLLIDGVWQDHVLNSLLNPGWRETIE